MVAIRKSDGEMITHPGHSMLLNSQNVVIVLGHRGDSPKFNRLYEIKHQIRYRGAKS